MIWSRGRDLWSVYRLQQQGVRLDLKGALLRPASPLYQATARSLPGFGIWSGRVLTVVIREEGRAGFVQARWRTGLPALDLLFIAPALDARHGAAWLWHGLLHELVRAGGERGVQRLFAHLPDYQHAEIEVMRQAGFAIYTQDRLYCRPEGPQRLKATDLLWKQRESVDEWGLVRLYSALTPAVVQQAETVMQDNHTEYAGWWNGTRRGCYVLRGQTEGDVSGHLSLTRGEHGHWLKMVLHPDRVQEAPELVMQALALMADWPQLPIYCDVRDYEGFLCDALERCGFERVMTRMLLVRHTTASVRVAPVRVVRTLENAPETAPTPF